ncbi:MAG: hypothetical protein ABMB14_10125, partial [Myxococcota bacterium]
MNVDATSTGATRVSAAVLPAIAAVGIPAIAVGLVAAGHPERALFGVALALVAACAIRAGSGVMVGIAVAAWLAATGPDALRFSTSPWIRTWNVFHYALGTEYFDELGYRDLYAAALRADEEQADRWDDVDRVRDLETYRKERRVRGGYDPAGRFAPDRWDAFRADVAALQPLASRSQWADMFRDRGYNPSPFFAAITRPITHALPVRTAVGRKALGTLDPIGYLIAFAALGRAFGARVAAIAAASFALSVVNDGRLIGGFLQYDWFVATALAVAAIGARKPVGAGIALGYAAVARVFPVAVAAAVIGPAVVRAVVRRRPVDRFTARFAGSFVASVAVALAIGASTGRGAAAWGEFADRMAIHTASHPVGEQRIGLAHLATLDWPLADSEDEREDLLEARRPLRLVIAGLGLAGVALALVRRRGPEAVVLGLAVVFLGTVASRYYYAILALAPVAGGPRRWRFEIANAALLAGGIAIDRLSLEPYPTYLAVEGLVAVGLGG